MCLIFIEMAGKCRLFRTTACAEDSNVLYLVGPSLEIVLERHYEQRDNTVHPSEKVFPTSVRASDLD